MRSTSVSARAFTMVLIIMHGSRSSRKLHKIEATSAPNPTKTYRQQHQDDLPPPFRFGLPHRLLRLRSRFSDERPVHGNGTPLHSRHGVLQPNLPSPSARWHGQVLHGRQQALSVPWTVSPKWCDLCIRYRLL
jgi:hypothetical protein